MRNILLALLIALLTASSALAEPLAVRSRASRQTRTGCSRSSVRAAAMPARRTAPVSSRSRAPDLREDRRRGQHRGRQLQPRRLALSAVQAIGSRYHRSRRDELRAVVVGEPRHELDRASFGDGDHACGDHWHRAVRAVGVLVIGFAASSHDIGGAMNCLNPGRPANWANQRSRWASGGLLTPSTPNQRLA